MGKNKTKEEVLKHAFIAMFGKEKVEDDWDNFMKDEISVPIFEAMETYAGVKMIKVENEQESRDTERGV